LRIAEHGIVGRLPAHEVSVISTFAVIILRYRSSDKPSS
jgi:hypothetical protein